MAAAAARTGATAASGTSRGHREDRRVNRRESGASSVSGPIKVPSVRPGALLRSSWRLLARRRRHARFPFISPLSSSRRSLSFRLPSNLLALTYAALSPHHLLPLSSSSGSSSEIKKTASTGAGPTISTSANRRQAAAVSGGCGDERHVMVPEL